MCFRHRCIPYQAFIAYSRLNSQAWLEAENLVLRQQVTVLRRSIASKEHVAAPACELIVVNRNPNKHYGVRVRDCCVIER